MPETNNPSPTDKERRQNAPRPEHELYKSPELEVFLAQERRAAERTRILGVKNQKRLWLKTLLFCGGIILVLLGLAVYDLLAGGA